MIGLTFEWDNRKNKANVRKYGVSFDEARSSFFDENAILFFDPDNSEDEDRFLLLGVSYQLNMLVVCHCFREEETVVRIVSVRKARDSVKYFKSLSEEAGIPYQTLINLYLRDCAVHKRKLDMQWR